MDVQADDCLHWLQRHKLQHVASRRVRMKRRLSFIWYARLLLSMYIHNTVMFTYKNNCDRQTTPEKKHDQKVSKDRMCMYSRLFV